jgi:hypothetical protein
MSDMCWSQEEKTGGPERRTDLRVLRRNYDLLSTTFIRHLFSYRFKHCLSSREVWFHNTTGESKECYPHSFTMIKKRTFHIQITIHV